MTAPTETKALVERLRSIARHDWRISFLAHTGDTAREAADTIKRLQAELGAYNGTNALAGRALVGAHEVLTTLCEFFGQREAGQPTTNTEATMFERVNYVASQIEAALVLTAQPPVAPEGDDLEARAERYCYDNGLPHYASGHDVPAHMAAFARQYADERVAEKDREIARLRELHDNERAKRLVLEKTNGWFLLAREAEREVLALREALRLVSEHDSVMARLEPDAHDAIVASLTATAPLAREAERRIEARVWNEATQIAERIRDARYLLTSKFACDEIVTALRARALASDSQQKE